MRDTHTIEILPGKEEKPCGIYLHADYCAEHERGIKEIWENFNIPGDKDESVIGISRYQMRTPIDENKLAIKKPTAKTYGWIGAELGESPDRITYKGRVNSDRLVGKWDDRGFVVGFTKTNWHIAEMLLAALRNGNLAAWIGGAGENPFARPGLILADVGLVNEDNKKTMADYHTNTAQLKAATEACGIVSLLAAANCRYFALKPRWSASLKTRLRHINNEAVSEPIQTAEKVVFFLNPYNQTDFHNGWFTVEELKDWIAGKGPVIKQKK